MPIKIFLIKNTKNAYKRHDVPNIRDVASYKNYYRRFQK
jgi:hypothetical protein